MSQKINTIIDFFHYNTRQIQYRIPIEAQKTRASGPAPQGVRGGRSRYWKRKQGAIHLVGDIKKKKKKKKKTEIGTKSEKGIQERGWGRKEGSRTETKLGASKEGKGPRTWHDWHVPLFPPHGDMALVKFVLFLLNLSLVIDVWGNFCTGRQSPFIWPDLRPNYFHCIYVAFENWLNQRFFKGK